MEEESTVEKIPLHIYQINGTLLIDVMAVNYSTGGGTCGGMANEVVQTHDQYEWFGGHCTTKLHAKQASISEEQLLGVMKVKYRLRFLYNKQPRQLYIPTHCFRRELLII